jgi:hypothetical protein
MNTNKVFFIQQQNNGEAEGKWYTAASETPSKLAAMLKAIL